MTKGVAVEAGTYMSTLREHGISSFEMEKSSRCSRAEVPECLHDGEEGVAIGKRALMDPMARFRDQNILDEMTRNGERRKMAN